MIVEEFMPPWKRIWRDGISPNLPTTGLEKLLLALKTDDPGLIQGSTTKPEPLMINESEDCHGACPIGFCGWGDGRDLVGEVEEFFAKVCWESDQLTGQPADIRFFLNWADDTPRAEFIRELLPEVERVLAARAEHQAAA
jgi:hypothetical protein